MKSTLALAIMLAFTVGVIFFLMNTDATPTGRVVASSGAVSLPPIVEGKQDVYLRATELGTYDPDYIRVKKGIPVRIHYSADLWAGCGREVIFPEFRIRKFAPKEGEVLLEFTPTRTGKFPFHCSMKMFNGIIEVVE